MILCVCNKSVIFDCDPEAGKNGSPSSVNGHFFRICQVTSKVFLFFVEKVFSLYYGHFEGLLIGVVSFIYKLFSFSEGLEKHDHHVSSFSCFHEKIRFGRRFLKFCGIFSVSPFYPNVVPVPESHRDVAALAFEGRVMARSYPIRTVIQLPIKRTLWP